MVVGHHQQLLIILTYYDPGAAAGNLVGLFLPEPGIALIEHGIVDGHNGRHGVLHDGGYIHGQGTAGLAGA